MPEEDTLKRIRSSTQAQMISDEIVITEIVVYKQGKRQTWIRCLAFSLP
jgi:hypothetical protein